MKHRKKFWTKRRRVWGYGVAVTSVPLAITLGLITEEAAAAIIPLAAAVFGVSSLAIGNLSDDETSQP